MTETHDESLCKRCGRCCYRKIWIEDVLYYTPTPCQYLDTETRLCTVYEKRHLLNPECLSVEEGIRLGVFPADCPYVRDLPHYRPPREEHTSVRSLFALLKQADESRDTESGGQP